MIILVLLSIPNEADARLNNFSWYKLVVYSANGNKAWIKTDDPENDQVGDLVEIERSWIVQATDNT